MGSTFVVSVHLFCNESSTSSSVLRSYRTLCRSNECVLQYEVRYVQDGCLYDLAWTPHDAVLMGVNCIFPSSMCVLGPVTMCIATSKLLKNMGFGMVHVIINSSKSPPSSYLTTGTSMHHPSLYKYLSNDVQSNLLVQRRYREMHIIPFRNYVHPTVSIIPIRNIKIKLKSKRKLCRWSACASPILPSLHSNSFCLVTKTS